MRLIETDAYTGKPIVPGAVEWSMYQAALDNVLWSSPPVRHGSVEVVVHLASYDGREPRLSIEHRRVSRDGKITNRRALAIAPGVAAELAAQLLAAASRA